MHARPPRGCLRAAFRRLYPYSMGDKRGCGRRVRRKVPSFCTLGARKSSENARCPRFVHSRSGKIGLQVGSRRFGREDFLKNPRWEMASLLRSLPFLLPCVHKTREPCIFRRFLRRRCAKQGNLASWLSGSSAEGRPRLCGPSFCRNRAGARGASAIGGRCPPRPHSSGAAFLSLSSNR